MRKQEKQTAAIVAGSVLALFSSGCHELFFATLGTTLRDETVIIATERLEGFFDSLFNLESENGEAEEEGGNDEFARP